ncbi:MAG: hypothetical protein HOV80_27295 [Polyangiaceae bacterium]|nr:hypothetical protein [Polyangiaceae bacterium]
MSPDPRAYNQASPAASPSAPKPEGERLQLDPYTGPRSHHASRAFADMVARRQRAKLRKKKMTLLLVGVVLGGTVAWFLFRLGAAALGL